MVCNRLCLACIFAALYNSSFACVGPETTSILHLYLIVFLVSVFGFLRYVPLFWIPIDGLLVDFIIICVFVSYIRWYVDLSTVDIRCLVACCIAAFVGVAISFYGQFHFDGLLGSTFANLYNGFFGSPASIFSLAIAISVLLIDLKMPHFPPVSLTLSQNFVLLLTLFLTMGPFKVGFGARCFPLRVSALAGNIAGTFCSNGCVRDLLNAGRSQEALGWFHHTFYRSLRFVK